MTQTVAAHRSDAAGQEVDGSGSCHPRPRCGIDPAKLQGSEWRAQDAALVDRGGEETHVAERRERHRRSYAIDAFDGDEAGCRQCPALIDVGEPAAMRTVAPVVGIKLFGGEDQIAAGV